MKEKLITFWRNITISPKEKPKPTAVFEKPTSPQEVSGSDQLRWHINLYRGEIVEKEEIIEQLRESAKKKGLRLVIRRKKDGTPSAYLAWQD